MASVVQEFENGKGGGSRPRWIVGGPRRVLFRAGSSVGVAIVGKKEISESHIAQDTGASLFNNLYKFGMCMKGFSQ